MAVVDSSLKPGAVGSYHVRPHSDSDLLYYTTYVTYDMP